MIFSFGFAKAVFYFLNVGSTQVDKGACLPNKNHIFTINNTMSENSLGKLVVIIKLMNNVS